MGTPFATAAWIEKWARGTELEYRYVGKGDDPDRKWSIVQMDFPWHLVEGAVGNYKFRIKQELISTKDALEALATLGRWDGSDPHVQTLLTYIEQQDD